MHPYNKMIRKREEKMKKTVIDKLKLVLLIKIIKTIMRHLLNTQLSRYSCNFFILFSRGDRILLVFAHNTIKKKKS